MAALTRQLLFVPESRRADDVYRAEALHDEIDPAQNYPFAFIQFRITGRRSAELADDEDEQVVLVGEAVKPDLRILIDALSRSMHMPLRSGEEAETAEALAARLNVSVKTLTRWRKAGLRWRWIVKPGAKRHVVYPRKAVEQFLAANSSLVSRAAKFSQMDDATRAALVRRARRLADATGASLHRIATHLSRRTGRVVETMRLMLEHHDRDQPDEPIFTDHAAPLTDEQKRAIARAYRRGVRVSELTRQYRRARSTIYRAIRQREVRALRRIRLDCVASPMFDRPDADEVLLRPLPVTWIEVGKDVSDDDLPVELTAYYLRPTLSREDQRRAFVRMNYLKHKASRVIAALDDQFATREEVETARQCIREAAAWRDRLIAANLHHVLAAARRHTADHTDRSVTRLLRLLELGVAVLRQRVEDHDPSRRQTFEAFLTYHLSVAMAQRRQDDDASARALPRQSVEAFLKRLPVIRPPA